MKTIKALSVHQPWASMIALGPKTIESRTWYTYYRGELLICSTKKINDNYRRLPYGQALCIVNLIECRPMKKSDEPLACCPCLKNLWSWVLRDVRKIEPFPVIGRQGLFNYQLPKGVKL